MLTFIILPPFLSPTTHPINWGAKLTPPTGGGANRRDYTSLYIWRKYARICRKIRFSEGPEMQVTPYGTRNKKIFSKQPFCLFTPCALLSNICFKRMYLSRINPLCSKRLRHIPAKPICEKPLIPFSTIFISIDTHRTYNASQCPHLSCFFSLSACLPSIGAPLVSLSGACPRMS